jgi:homoaconitase/3-isopropylmalate dehydratase large subunit
MDNLEFSVKIKDMKTMKEHEQERLLKAMVVPASELAKRKQEEEDRAKAFTRAAADEEFVNRTERSVSPNCPTPIGQRIGVITREPYEEQP